MPKEKIIEQIGKGEEEIVKNLKEEARVGEAVYSPEEIAKLYAKIEALEKKIETARRARKPTSVEVWTGTYMEAVDDAGEIFNLPYVITIPVEGHINSGDNRIYAEKGFTLLSEAPQEVKDACERGKARTHGLEFVRGEKKKKVVK